MNTAISTPPTIYSAITLSTGFLPSNPKPLPPSWRTSSSISLVVFFFQAEDGIRDGTVTGVQTCALPIWPCRCRNRRRPGIGSVDQCERRRNRHCRRRGSYDPGAVLAGRCAPEPHLRGLRHRPALDARPHRTPWRNAGNPKPVGDGNAGQPALPEMALAGNARACRLTPSTSPLLATRANCLVASHIRLQCKSKYIYSCVDAVASSRAATGKRLQLEQLQNARKPTTSGQNGRSAVGPARGSGARP